MNQQSPASVSSFSCSEASSQSHASIPAVDDALLCAARAPRRTITLTEAHIARRDVMEAIAANRTITFVDMASIKGADAGEDENENEQREPEGDGENEGEVSCAAQAVLFMLSLW
jgi:hypothetical protein